MNYRNVGMIAAVLVVAGAAFWWLVRAPAPMAGFATSSVPPAARPPMSNATPSAPSESPPAVRTSPAPPASADASAEWRSAFEHGAGVVDAFAAAAHAAEHGDPQALLTVR